MRNRTAALVVLVSLLLIITGCGGGKLASLDGGNAGYFNATSPHFTMNAGDKILVSYGVGPEDKNNPRSAISVSINGTGGTSDEVVTANSDKSDAVQWVAQQNGEFFISVAGYNAGYSVSVDKQ